MTAKDRGRLSTSLIAAALLGLSATGSAAVMLAITLWPGAEWGRLSPVATGHEARARQLLNEAEPGSTTLAEARSETLAGLRLSPMNGWAWLRLSFIETQENGFDVEAATALRKSYDVAPFGPQITSWRLSFAFSHWKALPADLKEAVRSELRASWLERRSTVDAAINRVTDLEGRLTARTMLRRLQIDHWRSLSHGQNSH